MKNLLLIPILIGSSLLATPQLSWVDQKVKEIKPSRVGMNNRTYKKIRDPFIYVKEATKKSPTSTLKSAAVDTSLSNTASNAKVKTSTEPFKLTMVINKSALVSGTWYKKGELIKGYELIEVSPSYITLKSKKKEKRIFLNEKNPNIKLNIK